MGIKCPSRVKALYNDSDRPYTYSVTNDATPRTFQDLVQSWFETVSASPASYEAREQAAEWFIANQDSDDAVSFGLVTLRGWLDLDARGADAKAVETLISDVSKWR